MCPLRYFPGGNPDAAFADKANYAAQVSKKCKDVEEYTYGVFFCVRDICLLLMVMFDIDITPYFNLYGIPPAIIWHSMFLFLLMLSIYDKRMRAYL